jgi:Co/Zn/Cd efflux system component
METKKKKRARPLRRHGDFSGFILTALLKKGPLSLEDLERLTSIMATQFEIVGTEFGTRIVSGFFSKLARPAAARTNKSKPKRDEPDVDIELECSNLMMKGLLAINETRKYQLTRKGEEKAKQFSEKMERGAAFFENQLLGPVAAARNTVILDFFLSVMKLTSGFFGGSIGLISDGTDSSVDTVSASVAWVGMKLKKESLGALITILLMFVAGISVGYDSITAILAALQAKASLITGPYLVIGVEGIALAVAAILFFYQRFTGKRNGSLSLISQSVDSKNHIYVAAMVITGAVFSIFGIPLVDALVGAFVAARILIDAVGLLKDMLSSIRGEKTSLSKYEVPFEKQWQSSKLATFRSWILYSVKEEQLDTRDAIINSLEKTFKPEYVPILSEFKFSLGKGFDFKQSFDDLLKPLLDERLLIQQNQKFILTDEGRSRVDGLLRNMRFARARLAHEI